MPRSPAKRARQASGRSLHREPALEQLELEVEAQHDVQVVGHLVGVGADQRALDLVDRAVERVERHAAELLRERRLQPRIEVLARSRGCGRRGSPTGATGSRARRPTCRSASGVPSKSASMPCSYSAWPASCSVLNSASADVVLAHARGDAHVAERELGHERMVRLVLAGRARSRSRTRRMTSSPNASCAGLGERPAAGSGRRRAAARVIARTIGTSSRAQLGEQRAHRRRLHAVVRDVDQRIGDVLVAGEEVGVLRGSARASSPAAAARRRSRSPAAPGSRPGRSAEPCALQLARRTSAAPSTACS